ncbi:MAG TPA: ABC transporter permease, partial [Gemmatimonadales bacterium]|nr:ABC transporter permease [Gemmatimonadales bacterium]
MNSVLADRAIRDARAALRSLRRAPSFAATAILVLALGIGSATATFSVLAAVLLKPLPVSAPERVVLPRILDGRGTDLALGFSEFKELRDATRTMPVMAGVAHQGAFETSLLAGDRPLTLKTAWVTGNFFDVLGTRPALGRLFHASDESLIEPSVMVLSYGAWRRLFAGDSGVLGRQFVNPYTQHTLTIVGVAPPGLDYPRGTEVWSPYVYAGGLDVLARLGNGVTVGAARSEFETIAQGLLARRPFNGTEFAVTRVRGLAEAVVGDVKPVLLALTGAVALLLVIACANVGTLLLLRLTAREQELAIRLSLGARTADILRQLLAESGILALGGGTLGLALAWLLVRAAGSLGWTGLPRVDVISQSTIPLIAAGAALLALGLVCAAPVLAVARPDLAARLRLDTRAGGGRPARRRLSRGFVAFQAAIALVLLSGAGLLERSLSRLQQIDLGFAPDHLSLLTVSVPISLGNASAQFAALLDRGPPALESLPGVIALTPIEAPPFFGP